MGFFNNISWCIGGGFKLNLISLRDFVNLVSWVPLTFFLVIFFITGTILVVIKDWRASVGAFLLQYLSMGLVLARLVRPEVAFAKVLVGLFICVIMYLSARQASWRHKLTSASIGLHILLGTRVVAGEVFPPGRAFRLMTVLLMGITAVSLGQNYPISTLPFVISIAVYWLCLAGFLLLILSENPLKIGQGLLTILIGFELWYTTLEGSLIVVGLWGSVNLILALAVGYLATVRSVILEEDF